MVTFVVKEKPAIRSILFTGNKALKDKDLKAVLDLKPFTVVQEKALRENADKIEALYLTKGYVHTTVKPVVVKVSDRSADVRFEIEEGERILVKRIEIDGNEAFPDDTLKDLMETKEKGPRSH
nr:POTRA domain-containing protein [Dissulfurirhabdus thermomarina]